MNFAVLKHWYDRREVICATPFCAVDGDEEGDEITGHVDSTAAFFLWLTYALGLRLWQGQGRCMDGLPAYQVHIPLSFSWCLQKIYA